jgi:hypothetical protein
MFFDSVGNPIFYSNNCIVITLEQNPVKSAWSQMVGKEDLGISSTSGKFEFFKSILLNWASTIDFGLAANIAFNAPTFFCPTSPNMSIFPYVKFNPTV